MKPARTRYVTDTLKGEFMELCHQRNAWMHQHDRFQARINNFFRDATLAGMAGDLDGERRLRGIGEMEKQNYEAARRSADTWGNPSSIKRMLKEHRHLKQALLEFKSTSPDLHPHWNFV